MKTIRAFGLDWALDDTNIKYLEQCFDEILKRNAELFRELTQFKEALSNSQTETTKWGARCLELEDCAKNTLQFYKDNNRIVLEDGHVVAKALGSAEAHIMELENHIANLTAELGRLAGDTVKQCVADGNVVIADSEVVDYLETEVEAVLRSIGIGSALVTDSTRMSDFDETSDKLLWQVAIDWLRNGIVGD